MTLHEELLDLQFPQSMRISPNKQEIVYSTSLTFQHRTGAHTISTLWLARLNQPKSAQQLTNGLHYDREPRWLPDGHSIAFLSDRTKSSESTAIYILPLNGGDPYALTPAANTRSIDVFEFSPDGASIAFISADERSEEESSNDAQVWGQGWAFNRLRLVHIASKTITVLASMDSHIINLAWYADGHDICFATTDYPETESSHSNGTAFHRFSAAKKSVKQLCVFPTRIGSFISLDHYIYFIGQASAKEMISASMVYSVDVEDKTPVYRQEAYGVENCAKSLIARSGSVVVEVENGMESQLRLLNGRLIFSERRQLTGWDVVLEDGVDEAVLAVALNSTNEAPETYSKTASSRKLVQLSDHGYAFAERDLGTGSFVSCPSGDGKVILDAVWHTPPGHDQSKEPLPTVVIIHGGPYTRQTDSIDNSYFMWGPVLLAAGYALLVPNYRGNSGRGEEFAAYARGAGKHDYEDIIALTQHVVAKGFADKSRLVVGGWSFGGFLTYLCAVRNGLHGYGWRFQAAMPGAGFSDLDAAIMTSDTGLYWAAIAGKRPWECETPDTSNRQSSALWELHSAIKKGATIPPMLILHGENDPRVPLEQARGMRRALQSMDLSFEYVVYPGEGHAITRRVHLLDIGKRIHAFVEKHIGKPRK